MKNAFSKLRDFVTAVSLLAFLSLVAVFFSQFSKEIFEGGARVVDGDSLIVEGTRIRLLGIDAPELSQTCRDQSGTDLACGKLARRRLADLIANNTIHCTTYRQDQYKRWLALCRAGSTQLNREMVRLGWAVAYGEFRQEENLAKSEGIGLWSLEFDRPERWRQDKSSAHVLGLFERWF